MKKAKCAYFLWLYIILFRIEEASHFSPRASKQPPPSDIGVYLSPAQYNTVIAELEDMDEDFAFEWHAANVRALPRAMPNGVAQPSPHLFLLVCAI
jgi:hypothetical protein